MVGFSLPGRYYFSILLFICFFWSSEGLLMSIGFDYFSVISESALFGTFCFLFLLSFLAVDISLTVGLGSFYINNFIFN